MFLSGPEGFGTKNVGGAVGRPSGFERVAAAAFCMGRDGFEDLLIIGQILPAWR
jgi:hypothetical protein